MTTTCTLTENDLATANVYESKRRDKYGRSVTHLEWMCRTMVVVTAMPATYLRDGKRVWAVNEWDGDRTDGRTPYTEFGSRKDALAYARERAMTYRNLRAANVAAGRGNVL